jgi:hypothetical protein
MDRTYITRFFGGSPLAVLLRLIALSVVVGLILTLADVSPIELFNDIIDLIWAIYEATFSRLEDILQWFLWGAVIVFPLWFVSRLIKVGRRSEQKNLDAP